MANRLTAVRFTLKQESTSNKSSRFLKGLYAPFFVVAFLSVTLMFIIVAVVYRNDFVQIHTAMEMLISFLYVLPFAALQCLFEEFVFRYSSLLIYKRVWFSEKLKTASKTIIVALFVVLISLVFAFMHFGNFSFVENLPLFFYYFLIGVYFSFLTFRYKNIALSFYLHFFNNLYTFLFVTVGESLDIFYPLFKLEVNPNNPVFLLLNLAPLVGFTEAFIKLLKIFPTDSKNGV